MAGENDEEISEVFIKNLFSATMMPSTVASRDNLIT